MTIAEKITRAKTDYDEVYEAGKQAEYDAFWDAFQQNGTRKFYVGGFCGQGWDRYTLRPKYIVKPSSGSTGSAFMFMFCNHGKEMIDFREIAHLFDFSDITNALSMFQDAWIDYIEIDISNVTSTGNMFSESYFSGAKTTITLTTSEKTAINSTMFAYTSKLANLTFTEGSVIGSSINLQYSPLNKESITSVVNALSATTTGQTATFKKSAKEAAFTADEWAALIATKSNWTISLI